MCSCFSSFPSDVDECSCVWRRAHPARPLRLVTAALPGNRGQPLGGWAHRMKQQKQQPSHPFCVPCSCFVPELHLAGEGRFHPGSVGTQL